MHAPDGFYSNSLCIIMDLACAGLLTYSVKKIWKKVNCSTLLIAAGVGAFIFALQMANFEISRGTSCHFMGGVLASILIGPYLATVVMTITHLVQVFIFQEGGIMALGPNLLTIVCISTFGGYYVFSLLKNLVIEPYGDYISAFLSAWLTLLITSLTVCGMLAVSGIEKFSATLGPMVGPHVVVGIIEGVLTVLIMVGLNIFKKGNYNHEDISLSSAKKIAGIMFISALLVSIFISPFASRSNTGLIKFALNRPNIELHKIIIPYKAPIPDYQFPGIKNPRFAKIFGSTLGTFASFLASFIGLLFIITHQKSCTQLLFKRNKIVETISQPLPDQPKISETD